jgi:hypothetical protein
MTKLTRQLIGVAASAAAVFALALPAQAVLVQYTSTYMAGLGDGVTLTPMTTFGTPTPEPGVNGLPACNQGLTDHNNAILPGAGFVNVGTGPAPQSLMFTVTPFKYGTANPTTGGLNAFGQPLGKRPGKAGVNGGPRYTTLSCSVQFTPNFMGDLISNRTHMSFISIPYMPVTANERPGTRDLTLAAGAGIGNLVRVMTTGTGSFFNQVITVTAGSQTFGGGLRATGGGRIDLGVNTNGGFTLMGFWLTGPRIFGHGVSVPTQLVTNMNIFQHQAVGPVPVTLRVENFPFTTGRVVQNESGGDYISHRTSTGSDNRTPNGTNGTLSVVSPWNGNLSALGLWFGGTGRIELNLMPEPGATALLAAGILTVLGLYVARRR